MTDRDMDDFLHAALDDTPAASDAFVLRVQHALAADRSRRKRHRAIFAAAVGVSVALALCLVGGAALQPGLLAAALALATLCALLWLLIDGTTMEITAPGR